MNTDITVTTNAVMHIKKQLAKRGRGIGMRLSVKDAGCSGKKYVVDFIDAQNPNDMIFTLDENIVLCIDPQSFVYLAGTNVDYKKSILGGKFIFQNPNEKAACGCGESFHV